MNKVNGKNMNIAEELLKIRKNNNLSQDEFAEKIGVSRQAVSRWEMGISAPSIDTLVKISERFGVSIDSMLKSNEQAYNEKITIQERPKLSRRIIGIVITLIGLIGISTLPLLADYKRDREMQLFKSAYENSAHYLIEYPLFILLLLFSLLLVAGIYFIIKNRR
ncbi:helix-turn-helix domain-containing protein [Calorimonas adulescens]|nr:helix-turn-helix transcriptional regulator [Calorimonas adulescens]